MSLPSKGITNRFAMPKLEGELRRTRHLGSSAALEARGEITNMMVSPQYRGSCVQDADECEIVCDESVYRAWGLKPHNGTTIVKAKYSKKPISGHFHTHIEGIKVVSGAVWFELGGKEMTLGHNDTLEIPARSIHVCEFLDETVLMVSIPTDVLRQLLN